MNKFEVNELPTNMPGVYNNNVDDSQAIKFSFIDSKILNNEMHVRTKCFLLCIISQLVHIQRDSFG